MIPEIPSKRLIEVLDRNLGGRRLNRISLAEAGRDFGRTVAGGYGDAIFDPHDLFVAAFQRDTLALLLQKLAILLPLHDERQERGGFVV